MSRELKIITIIGSIILFFSIIAVVLTVLDKFFAKKKKRRIPERILLLFAWLGGSVAMYITMRLIHHKTRKAKFMSGLPVITFIHIALLLALLIALKVI